MWLPLSDKKCAFAYTHSPIFFHFAQNPRDFVVKEEPLYPFSGIGEHLILQVRKKNLTTFSMLKIISSIFGIKEKEIGYAGLKDKNALTSQFISLPKNKVDKEKLANFKHEEIKILSQTYHQNKIKLGHLKGNHFFIRIKKLDTINHQKILEFIKKVQIFGLPNYFSYQRFGNDGENYLVGKEIVEGRRKLRSKKMEQFLISSYQSYLFNQWLSCRIELSRLIESFEEKQMKNAILEYFKNQFCDDFKEELQEILNADFCKDLKRQKHFFKLFVGDYLCHYPFGKNFKIEEVVHESERYLQKEVVPTGLLSGIKAQNAEGFARVIEERFMDLKIKSVGQRRFAWIFLENLEYHYKEEEAQGEFHFFLPKGAYATNFLRELAHQEISLKEEE